MFGGLPQDVTEENIQSRARGLLLMSMSNKFGALVLSTGNKSELAVGYCTLYGDMVGGGRHLRRTEDVSLPSERLREFATQSDSGNDHREAAFCRIACRSKDSDSLPPYDVLDAILEDFVEESCSAEQIVRNRHFDPNLVRRVIRMVERSEYKRQQAAPGIKISAKAFGYGRRFPIAAKSEIYQFDLMRTY